MVSKNKSKILFKLKHDKIFEFNTVSKNLQKKNRDVQCSLLKLDLRLNSFWGKQKQIVADGGLHTAIELVILFVYKISSRHLANSSHLVLNFRLNVICIHLPVWNYFLTIKVVFSFLWNWQKCIVLYIDRR